MSYARIVNNLIDQTWNGKPKFLKVDDTEYNFSVGTTDTQYAEFNIYPITTIQSERDQYHTYTEVMSVVDGLPVRTYTVTEVSLEDAKAIKAQEIHQAWEEALTQGSFISEAVPGFSIDCRRNGRDADRDNIEVVIEDIETGADTEPTMWVGVSEIRTVSLVDLKAIRREMGAYGRNCYNRKFMAQYILANAETLAEVQAVTF